MIQFREIDARLMKQAEQVLVRALMPFRENTEASLIVFALMRCARVLLRLYPEATRKELTRVCVGYLEGKTEEQVIVPPGPGICS